MKKIFIFLMLFLLVGCSTTVKKEQTKTTDIVPTMYDKISENGIWVGTFQLVWNDLKNELVKQDVDIDHEMARNLNKEGFTAADISEEYYYKKYGKASLDLKAEIEKGIKDKFNQGSEILDNLDWTQGYIFYTMLYREFEFESKFDVLSNTDFGIYKDIKFFGISPPSSEKLGEQITILFYENDQNFAISLKTKSGDQVIMYKNPSGETFEEIYDNMNQKIEAYEGTTVFSEKDEFKAPMISINYLRDYEELKHIPFLTVDGDELEIEEALQTVEFILDEKGGKVKSEAVIETRETAMLNEAEPKKLYLNDTFALFLKEEKQEKPYLAAKITDITKFQ